MRFKTLAAVAFITGMMPTMVMAQENVKGVLKKLIPPNINYTYQIEKNSALKGFIQLDIAIKKTKTGTIYHRYLWISKDKKLVVPVLLRVTDKGVERINPQKIVEKSQIDLSWVNKLLSELPLYAKKSIGKGKDVYMFSDPFCPFCKRELPRLVKMAEAGKIRLHILPFDVHGPQAKKASAIFLEIEEKEGLKNAINKIESADFNSVSNLVKNTKNIDKIYKKHKPVLDKIEKTAFRHGINGTPAMVIFTSKNKGYLLMGLSNIQPYIK